MEFGRSSPCVLSRSISQLLYTPLYPSPQNQAARLSGPLPAFQVCLSKSHCLKITHNVSFVFLYFGFFHQVLPIKIDLSGNTV